MKYVKRTILVIVGAFVLSILFSLLFPRKVKVVDDVRMVAQRPLIKWIGTIKMDDIPMMEFSDTSKNRDITFEELLLLIKNLTPGTIFLTRTRNYAITEFIPSKWEHSGIFLGTKKQVAQYFGEESSLFKRLDTLMNSSDIYVLDSTADGVQVHPIKNLSNMRDVSYLTNFASFSFNQPSLEKALFIEGALKYLGREYDYDWLTEDDECIFCSELLYHAFNSVGINIKERTTTVSRYIFTPDNLFDYLLSNSGKNKAYTFNGSFCKKNGAIIDCFEESNLILNNKKS